MKYVWRPGHWESDAKFYGHNRNWLVMVGTVRYRSDEPPPPYPLPERNAISAWLHRDNDYAENFAKEKEWKHKAVKEGIDPARAGMRYVLETAQEMLDLLVKLRQEGYEISDALLDVAAGCVKDELLGCDRAYAA